MSLTAVSKKEFPWELSVQYLKKVGPNRAFLLSKLDIKTIEDLLFSLPFRYEDRTAIKKIAQLIPGDDQTAYGEIRSASLIDIPHRRMKIFEATVVDETGLIHAKWFNQPYLAKQLGAGDRVMISGKVRKGFYGGAHLEMENPQYEKVDSDEPTLHMGRIVPIYHETKGLTSRQIRSIVKGLLDQYGAAIPEMLPPQLIERHRLLSLSEAISSLHFPPKEASLPLLNSGRTLSHQRLAFDELFLLETGLALRKAGVATKEPGISFHTDSRLVETLKAILPFQLTGAQERVLGEIANDMRSVHPMHRLIQGDVGSGKTLVALMSICVAIENGYQAALMAPTEILAEQHFFCLKRYFEVLGRSILLLTSDMKKKEKADALKKIASCEVDLVVGTHALIQEQVCFPKLGLAVIDEQHKFGVLQRAKLSQSVASPVGNAGAAGEVDRYRPDLLIMTATPIPRTLALTLYGDLTISVIDEMPKGRSPIETGLFYAKERERVYQKVERELRAGRQAYLVCPLVEESEAIDLKAARELSSHLQNGFFAHRRVGLLHGRLKREEKERIMRAFYDGQIDLLVATTVVEVGIDVPNATVMVIEHAERFGLAQLHQLRGRVGRGAHASYCFLIADYAQSQEAKARLRIMQKSTDGFKIAEEDMRIRGPGAFFGTRQSGLPELKVANLIRDSAILEMARKEAFQWVENDPGLNQPESLPIRSALERKWKGKLEWLTTG